MFFLEFAADILEVDGIEGNHLSKQLSFYLLVELLVGIAVEKGSFFPSMCMKITIKEHSFLTGVLLNQLGYAVNCRLFFKVRGVVVAI